MAEKNINLDLFISALENIETENNFVPFYKINLIFSHHGLTRREAYQVLKHMQRLKVIRIRRTKGVILLQNSGGV